MLSIHSSCLCLLIGVFDAFTFKVMIEKGFCFLLFFSMIWRFGFLLPISSVTDFFCVIVSYVCFPAFPSYGFFPLWDFGKVCFYHTTPLAVLPGVKFFSHLLPRCCDFHCCSFVFTQFFLLLVGVGW